MILLKQPKLDFNCKHSPQPQQLTTYYQTIYISPDFDLGWVVDGYLAKASHYWLQLPLFQEQDKGSVAECLCWTPKSTNFVRSKKEKTNYFGYIKKVQRLILNCLPRDMEKNNISEIHEDAFLPLNNLKDLWVTFSAFSAITNSSITFFGDGFLS